MAASSKVILIVKNGPESGKIFHLSENEMIIGRTKETDVAIDNPQVSRRHARLSYRDGSYWIEDLDSRNGTHINSKPITKAEKLNSGDEIELAPGIVLTFEDNRNLSGASHPTRLNVQDKTMLESLSMFDASTLKKDAPTLVVTVAGSEPQEFKLEKVKLTLGRADENDIVIPSLIVSRRQATLQLTPSGFEIATIEGATNTITCQGHPVTGRQLLKHEDVLRIDSEFQGMMVSMTFLWPSQAPAKLQNITRFGEKNKLTIGRDPSNDVVIDQPNASRFHAQITRVGRRYFVTDLRSSNGTFVNNQRVEGDVWLNPSDTVRIGSYKFVLDEDQFIGTAEVDGLRVEAYHLNKWVRKDLNLLQDISLVFQPREFICVVGQSGGGKSTLVDSIAGYRPATNGSVFVNDINVYQNFDAIRNEIGYVPQKDIIHMELTVYQALDYAAQLRMPKDTTRQERQKRIMEVLADLDLTHRKDVQISGLSGGQQKRVSIGVELLTRPGLFFLDEPTSGLDPGTETAFMHLMRRLADQGRTIIMVTHATKNVMLADKVVFLARGGYLAWFGPPNEALAYFDQFRSESDRRTRPMEFDQIYAILDDQSKGKAADWASRFQKSPAFQKYIVTPLQERFQQAAAKKPEPKKKTTRRRSPISALQQFIVLSKRNVKILTRDRSSLTLMLAAAPGVGALDLVLAPVMGRSPFAYSGGDAANGAITLFLLSLYALLVGGMSQMREFVKESEIYQRERLVNLQIIPYVTSKI